MMRRKGLRRRSRFEEDVNPMDGIVNIVDAMLVFACGLMLSVVIYWNVDLEDHKMVSVDQGSDVTEVEGMQDKLGENSEGEGSGEFERMGSVYRDPETGKLYMLEE